MYHHILDYVSAACREGKTAIFHKSGLIFMHAFVQRLSRNQMTGLIYMSDAFSQTLK